MKFLIDKIVARLWRPSIPLSWRSVVQFIATGYSLCDDGAGAQKGKGNLVKYHRFATHVFGKWNSRRCLTHRKRHTSIESLCWRGEVCLDLLE
jgi:hypothetical protein